MNEEKKATDRKFETLFDGDEIDGKRYKLGAVVTGLDAPTAEYLIRAGRIAEIDDDRAKEISSDKSSDKKASSKS